MYRYHAGRSSGSSDAGRIVGTWDCMPEQMAGIRTKTLVIILIVLVTVAGILVMVSGIDIFFPVSGRYEKEIVIREKHENMTQVRGEWKTVYTVVDAMHANYTIADEDYHHGVHLYESLREGYRYYVITDGATIYSVTRWTEDLVFDEKSIRYPDGRWIHNETEIQQLIEAGGLREGEPVEWALRVYWESTRVDTTRDLWMKLRRYSPERPGEYTKPPVSYRCLVGYKQCYPWRSESYQFIYSVENLDKYEEEMNQLPPPTPSPSPSVPLQQAISTTPTPFLPRGADIRIGQPVASPRDPGLEWNVTSIDVIDPYRGRMENPDAVNIEVRGELKNNGTASLDLNSSLLPEMMVAGSQELSYDVFRLTGRCKPDGEALTPGDSCPLAYTASTGIIDAETINHGLWVIMYWTGYQYRAPLPSLAQFDITHKEQREVFVSGCWQGGKISLSYNGGPDSSRVDRFRVYVKDQELTPALVGSPGSTTSFPSDRITSRGDVIVIVRYTDGMEQGVGINWCASSEKAPWG
jgi:hypothetical protein